MRRSMLSSKLCSFLCLVKLRKRYAYNVKLLYPETILNTSVFRSNHCPRNCRVSQKEKAMLRARPKARNIIKLSLNRRRYRQLRAQMKRIIVPNVLGLQQAMQLRPFATRKNSKHSWTEWASSKSSLLLRDTSILKRFQHHHIPIVGLENCPAHRVLLGVSRRNRKERRMWITTRPNHRRYGLRKKYLVEIENSFKRKSPVSSVSWLYT